MSGSTTQSNGTPPNAQADIDISLIGDRIVTDRERPAQSRADLEQQVTPTLRRSLTLVHSETKQQRALSPATRASRRRLVRSGKHPTKVCPILNQESTGEGGGAHPFPEISYSYLNLDFVRLS